MAEGRMAWQHGGPCLDTGRVFSSVLEGEGPVLD